MIMTDGEILSKVRQNGLTDTYLRVLAELNGTNVECIREILKKNEIKLKEKETAEEVVSLLCNKTSKEDTMEENNVVEEKKEEISIEVSKVPDGEEQKLPNTQKLTDERKREILDYWYSCTGHKPTYDQLAKKFNCSPWQAGELIRKDRSKRDVNPSEAEMKDLLEDLDIKIASKPGTSSISTLINLVDITIEAKTKELRELAVAREFLESLKKAN